MRSFSIDKFRALVSPIGILLFLMILSVDGTELPEEHKQINPSKALELVEQFYEELLGNKKPEECTDLFDNSINGYSGKKRKELLTKKWKYLKENKQLFLTNRYSQSKFHTEKDFFRKAKKGYWYFNPPEGEDIHEGLLIVTLSAVIKKGFVWKHITFPVVYEENTETLKLVLDFMKVNGLRIDPYGLDKYNFDLLQQLGFKKPL